MQGSGQMTLDFDPFDLKRDEIWLNRHRALGL